MFDFEALKTYGDVFTQMNTLNTGDAVQFMRQGRPVNDRVYAIRPERGRVFLSKYGAMRPSMLF